MTYLEMNQLLQNARDAMFTNLKEHLEANGPLTREGRAEVIAETKVLRRFIASNDYTPNAQAMAETVLANAKIRLPRGTDTYQKFCVETAKMLDALWQVYLMHSEALEGKVNLSEPTPAPRPHAVRSSPDGAYEAQRGCASGDRELLSGETPGGFLDAEDVA